MGLTIHYSLATQLTRPGDVRDLVESIRQVARDLPFKEVGELIEFKGQDADYEASGKEDEHRWFKIQAGAYVEAGDRHYSVKPSHIIGFSTWPGEGCEPANLGFCKYPAFITCRPAARSGSRRSSPAGPGNPSAKRNTPAIPSAEGSRTSFAVTCAW